MSEINQDDDFLCGVCGRVHVRSEQDADCAQARIAELEAEVERLRWAVERVRDQVRSRCLKHDDAYIVEALTAALVALEEKR